METLDHVQLLFGASLRHIPTLTIEFIGLWFAFARRVELGRASTYAIIGFISLIVYALVSIVLQHLLVIGRIGETTVISSAERVTRLGVWSAVSYPLFICGLGSLARAIFVGRSAKRREDSGWQGERGAV